MRAVNIKKIDIYRVKENLNLAIAAAKGVGCKIHGINPEAFIEKKPHLILGYLWQILRLQALKEISLQSVPEIIRLAKEGEELVDL
jgi:hypothetical protein